MSHFVITYVNADNSHFDFDYYLNTHIPMGDRLLGDYGLLKTEVEQGLPDSGGGSPGYVCITRLFFTDAERMTAGFAAHGAELKADILNYTNIEPVVTLVKTLV
jgi:uncharacterized protein (TIGR02118 family)